MNSLSIRVAEETIRPIDGQTSQTTHNCASYGAKGKTMLVPIIICILIALYVVSDALVIIPGPSYGVHLRFGKRTGKIYEEGLGLKIPIIDTVELFSTELDKIEVSANFTAKDKLDLTLSGSLQYRPDSHISDDTQDLHRPPGDRKGKNTFFAMSNEIIKSGIEDAVEALLGGLGGVYDGQEFIGNRQALGSIINSVLRLEKPRHLNHDSATCGVHGCTKPQKIDAKDLVDFYNSHWTHVKDAIDRRPETEYSPIEVRYGIDIEIFALASVDFSEATKEAFEKKKQAEVRKEAFAFKMEMAKNAKDLLGATAQEALNAADVSLDPEVKKQVVSVEGQAGILGGIIGKLGGK